jgi:IS5 family transposase
LRSIHPALTPTDARLLHRARERLVRLAQTQGVRLRQSYRRVGKRALIQHQRYAHAKQFKRANRALRTLRTHLGRVIRDIGDDARLRAIFAWPLSLARRVREQRQRQRGPKVYSLQSTVYTHLRWSASAKASHTSPTSSG